jgi:hypothetical protein
MLLQILVFALKLKSVAANQKLKKKKKKATKR